MGLNAIQLQPSLLTRVNLSVYSGLWDSSQDSIGKPNEILVYGENNEYPEVIDRLISNSSTAKCVRDVMAKFIHGLGFENEALNDIITGQNQFNDDINLVELDRSISSDLASYNGFYCFISRSINFQVSKSEKMKFGAIRLGKTDDNGRISYAVLRQKRYQKLDFLRAYSLFSESKETISERIEKLKASKKAYQGEFFVGYFDMANIYPISPFHATQYDMDSESLISVHRNTELANGMSPKTIITVAEASEYDERTDKEGNTIKTPIEGGIAGAVKEFVGTSGAKVMVLSTKVNEETGKIDQDGSFIATNIASNIDSETYDQWEKAFENHIRRQACNMPSILFEYETGKLGGGTKAEDIMTAIEFYNSQVNDYQEFKAKCYRKMFKNSINDILKSEAAKKDGFKIKNINYDSFIRTTTSNTSNQSK